MRTASRRKHAHSLPDATTVPVERRLGWRVDELAALSGIPRSSLFELIRTGALGAVRFSPRALWVPREAWDAFCAARRVKS